MLLLLNNLLPTSKFYQGSFCIFFMPGKCLSPTPLPSKNCNDVVTFLHPLIFGIHVFC